MTRLLKAKVCICGICNGGDLPPPGTYGGSWCPCKCHHKLGQVCIHRSLRRKCDLCDANEEIDRLIQLCAEQQTEIESQKHCYKLLDKQREEQQETIRQLDRKSVV